MDLDDMKALWTAYDRKLEASMRLNTHLLAQANLGKVRTSLRSLGRGLAIELAFNVIAVLLIGSFAADRVSELRFFVPALVLGLYAIAIAASCAWQIARLSNVDYDEPVLAIQRKLDELRIRRVAFTRWILLTSPLMWGPLLVVLLRAAGIDAYAVLGPAYLAANLAFGLLIPPLALWLSKQYGARLRSSSVCRALADDLAGRSLIGALDSLDTLSRFEDDRV